MYLFRGEGTRYAAGMIDLKSASRDDLIRLVIAQHERIAALEATVAEQRGVIATLEATAARLTVRVDALLATAKTLRRGDDGAGSGRPQGMPGLKAAPRRRVHRRKCASVEESSLSGSGWSRRCECSMPWNTAQRVACCWSADQSSGRGK